MYKKMKKIGKEILKEIALSFFFCASIILLISWLYSKEIRFGISLINKIAIVENKKSQPITYNEIKKRLDHYPNYKEKYGNLKIPTINVELPIYHGDSMDILRYGVGHYAGSYFPGEGGTIIFAGHNNTGFFRELPNINIEDKIEVETLYGTFYYQVTETKIISESDLASFPLQNESEVLILYTCYPVTSLGYTNKRYIVYATRIEDIYE